MTAEALLPVGKDCDCGHPLIWWQGNQRCAVYGTHNHIDARELDLFRTYGRNPFAPGAALVNALAAMPSLVPKDVRRRHLKAVS